MNNVWYFILSNTVDLLFLVNTVLQRESVYSSYVMQVKYIKLVSVTEDRIKGYI